ncbi:trypsin-like serine peptidase [Sphaerimonospora sp. CA-214678]|uniref:trypsin-like serine peptidase n=1 Tax=Sphaerimonospora sp. CA-214678 TaxID=3240029 RepID=UPI003D8BC8F8
MPLSARGVVAMAFVLVAGMPAPAQAQAVPGLIPRMGGYDIAVSDILATSSAVASTASFWLEQGGRALLSATPYTPETEIAAQRAFDDGPGPDGAPGLVTAIAGTAAKRAAADPAPSGGTGNGGLTNRGSKNVNLPKTVGKAFFIGADGHPHWCSATSVRSDHGNLVATAGHCVYDVRPGTAATTMRNWVFIPGYRRGGAPWGVYVGRQAFTHRDFATYGDADRDYAFVNVHTGLTPQRAGATDRSPSQSPDQSPKRSSEQSTNRSATRQENPPDLTDTGRLGDRVGGQGIAYNLKIGRTLVVIGHPTRGGDSLVSSYGRPYGAADPAIKATGLIGLRPARADATGSPWLAGYRGPRGLGYLNGLTIGFAGSGRTATAVSPYFDGELHMVYQAARKSRP